MKLSALSFANAAALTSATLWVICATVAMVLPDFYQAGADLLSFGNIGHFNLSVTSVVFGGMLFIVIAWISGYLFGWSLEKFSVPAKP